MPFDIYCDENVGICVFAVFTDVASFKALARGSFVNYHTTYDLKKSKSLVYPTIETA